MDLINAKELYESTDIDESKKDRLRTTSKSSLVDSGGEKLVTPGGHLGVKVDPADFRLMIVYQSQILKQLEKINKYMAIMTGEEEL